MRSYLDALLRYFAFTGRTGRARYWLYQLVVVLVFCAAIALEYFANGKLPRSDSPLLVFLSIFHTIPGISITVRRLHDTGRSGWWYLLYCVPLGGLWVIYWTCLRSDPGTNPYGDPDGASNSRRADPEPFYARALRPSAASNPSAGSPRLNGAPDRFI